MKRILARLFPALVLVFLVLLMAPGEVEQVTAAPLLQTNLLNNPSFEEPYSGGTAQSWAKQHENANVDPKPENCSGYYAVLPVWSPELNTDIIIDGARSQHIGNQFDTWHAVVMQNVNVTPGSTYRFTFWGTGRASNDQYPTPSDTSVNLNMQARIDPNGSGNMFDSDIVNGAAGSPHMSGGTGNWQQFTVEATATGNQMTVFASANLAGANQCRAHLDVWFDKAELIEVGPPATNTPAPPPPQPTSPPQPVITNTPLPPPPTATSEAPPTTGPAPTVGPTNTPIPPASSGGVICVNAFADNNANGVRDPDEGYMAGVTFVIIQDGQVVAQGVSTGTSTPVCFENIPPGTYTVAQQVPRNLEMTTAPSATIEVTEGSTISLEFGSRVKTDDGGDEIAGNPTLTPEGGSSPEEGSGSDGGNGLNVVAIIGLGAILLAIVLLVALVIILLRQQRAN